MLIAISIVRNEASRYLRAWLENVSRYADRHVVLDDGSDDGTLAILREWAARDRRVLVEANASSIFAAREQELRAQLWELTRPVAKAGDWIIVVDADEFYDQELVDRKADLLARRESTVRFRCLDLWAEGLYRVDGHWSGSFTRMFRFENLPFGATTPGLNESPLPEYARHAAAIGKAPAVYRTGIRCLHRGWLRDEDRRRKYEYYLGRLQRAFDLKHVRSSLERPPRLRPCHEDYRCLAERAGRVRAAARALIRDLAGPARRLVRGWRRQVGERIRSRGREDADG